MTTAAETAEPGTHIDVVQIDPHDEVALRAWHATYLEAETRGRPFATPWMYEEMRAAAQAPPVGNERVLLSGVVGGQVVSVAQLILPLKDNLDLADFHVHTHPDHRRRGYAGVLLGRVEELAAERGATRLLVMVDHPYELGPTGDGEPGVELLRGHGFTHAVGEVQSACPLPVPAAVLDALASEAAQHHHGYALRSFVDRCPDDLVASFGRAMGMLVAEAPTGTIDFEPEIYDEERIRSQETTTADSGRTSYVTVALDTTGEVVAYTQLAVARHDPGRVYQWGTLVGPGHRGYRLGLAVKTANLALLQENEVDLSTLVTYNAEVNDHMIAVNRRLGFVPVARCAQLEKALSAQLPQDPPG